MLSKLPCPTVVIIDDAQTLEQATLRRLIERASPALAILIVSAADSSVQRGNIFIAKERAVDTLAETFAQRRDEILAIVHQLDDHVGEGYTDTWLEDRLREAAKTEFPWQFAFVLTGGWRRAQDELAALRERDRADLLLAAVAAVQLVSLDTGATRQHLERAANVLGRDADWITRSLATLEQRRLVIGTDTLRCPHLRFASVVLRLVCRSRRDAQWDRIVLMLRSVLRDKNVPLRGASWLLQELRFTDGFLGDKTDTIINDATWHHLASRCWAATTGAERGDAAFLLSALQDWHPSRLSEIAEKATLLGRWLEEVVPESSQGVAWFFNDLSQERRKLGEEICDYADPSRIAASVAQTTWADAYAWGNLLGRLAAVASHPWHTRMCDAIDTCALLALADTAQPGVLWELGQFARGIWSYLPDMALEMLEQATPTIVDRINAAPAEAFAVAEVNWAARLRGRTEERRAIAALVDAASSTGGPIAEVGARLQRKFPRATFHRVDP